jgi:lipopolysaccharide transport system permease protein
MIAAKTNTPVDVPILRIEPAKSWVALRLAELWEYRELLYFMIWRDVKVRYKQTALGIAWAMAQPLMTMLVFTLVFNRFGGMQSEGVPYPLFSYAALMVWTYFAKSLQSSIVSVAGNAHLVNKIYFPRLLLPISATLSGLFDFAISFVLLLGLLAWYGVMPSWPILTLPIFLLFAILTALSLSLWLSAINVKYRDIGQAIPFLIQLWLFVSPVAYAVTMIPERWRLLYSLNPMVGVIEGFRWALFGNQFIAFDVFAISAISVVGFLWGGLYFFKRMERTFADLV